MVTAQNSNESLEPSLPNDSDSLLGCAQMPVAAPIPQQNHHFHSPPTLPVHDENSSPLSNMQHTPKKPPANLKNSELALVVNYPLSNVNCLPHSTGASHHEEDAEERNAGMAADKKRKRQQSRERQAKHRGKEKQFCSQAQQQKARECKLSRDRETRCRRQEVQSEQAREEARERKRACNVHYR
jgi:hypothetical protein